MKSFYPTTTQVLLLPHFATVKKYAKQIFLLWFISFSLAWSPAFSQGLVFQNPRLVSGIAGADKAIYRFPNVKSGLDALVSIKGRSSNKVTLSNIDVTASGHPQSFQPQVSYNGGTAPGLAKWYMDFEVVLVAAGTTKRTKVAEIDVTAIDIDGNGDKIREFIVFNDPIGVTRETVTSLKIDESPVIDFDAENGDPVMCGVCNKATPLVLCTPCSGSGVINTLVNGVLKTNNCSSCNGSGKLLSGCNHPYKASNVAKGAGKAFTYTGPITNYANIDTFATQVMVTGTWVDTDVVTFRVGGENISGGSQGAADRMYSLWFKEFRYLGAALLPVKLINWKASLVKNTTVLNWTATQQTNVSYYGVERSYDGRNYIQVGSVTSTGKGDLKKDYSYSDNQAALHTAVCYYRLKTVDMDGKYQYSDVRTVKAASSSNLVITTYPNPTVNMLHIVVPANWQSKKVSFEIFNVNGVLVKSVVNTSAGQIEDMQVSALSRGVYMVKATAGEMSAVERMMKSN